MGPLYKLPFCPKKKMPEERKGDTYTPKTEEKYEGDEKEEEEDEGTSDLGPPPEDRGE